MTAIVPNFNQPRFEVLVSWDSTEISLAELVSVADEHHIDPSDVYVYWNDNGLEVGWYRFPTEAEALERETAWRDEVRKQVAEYERLGLI